MTSIPQSPSYPFPRPSPHLSQQQCSPSRVAPRVVTLPLPPLSLPLPAPRLSRQPSTPSEQSDAESEIRTPTTPTPPSAPIPDGQPQFYIASSSSAQKLNKPVVSQRPPTPTPTPSHPARIRDLADVIQRVYTGYTRQDRLLQSPLILDALVHFRERAEDLLDALEAEKRGRRGRGHHAKKSEVERAKSDERLGRDVQELEEEWWSSAVVANWFGPQPHTVKRQKSRRRRKGHKPVVKVVESLAVDLGREEMREKWEVHKSGHAGDRWEWGVHD